jgi:hypothetical protein
MQAKVSGKRRKEMTEACLMDAVLHPINLQDAQEGVIKSTVFQCIIESL